MFTEAQKVDIRRFCGYEAYGAGASGFEGWRFFQAYGTLEYKLNNLDPTEETVIETIYLANLYALEAAIPAAGANLDTDEASVWKHNRREVEDRVALLTHWRLELCRFLGVPPGAGLVGRSSLALVV